MRLLSFVMLFALKSILSESSIAVCYLSEAEDIKRWQEYTEELYKNDLQTKIITMV